MDLDAILDEVRKMSGREEMRPDEFTTKNYMEKFGMPEGVVRRSLAKLVKEGFLERRTAYRDGHFVIAYRKVAHE